MDDNTSVKAVFNWSGGKDSALALHRVLKDNSLKITELLTTVNRDNRRIIMHGVRESLLEAQAGAIGIPLRKVILSPHPDGSEYEDQMLATLSELSGKGCRHAVFGDIFLDDLKTYRETQLARAGFDAIFPLWKEDTLALMKEFISLGFKAVVVCVDAAKLSESFAGRLLDESFLRDLPEGVDPCGENGEFHSFVFDGPVFQHPVKFRPGEVTYREYPALAGNDVKPGFYFRDLLPE